MDEKAAKVVVGRTGWLWDQPDWVRDAVLSGSRMRTYEPGQFTFYAEDDPGGMYGIVDGGFGVVVPSARNELVLCHVMRCGTWFGNGPILTGVRRTMTFKAVEPSRVLHLPLSELTAIVARQPEFVRKLGALTEATYMLAAVRVVGDLLISSGDRRIAAVLVRIAKPQPSSKPQPPWPIRLSQAEIGQMSNSSRDRVNRALAKFVKAGWITTDFKMIVVKNLAELESFSNA